MTVFQGCKEHIDGKPYDPAHPHNAPLKVSFVPLQNTIFQELINVEAVFDAAKEIQKFPPTLVKINFDNFFIGGKDYTRASLSYFPLVVHMRATNSAYESIFYMQFSLNRGAPPSIQLLKQKIIFNGQLFELTEAYGLKSNGNNDNTEECVICLTNPKDTICKPCKHVSLCTACAQVVFQSEKKCPVCRQGISEIIPFKITT